LLTHSLLLAVLASGPAAGAQTSKFDKPKLTLEAAQKIALTKQSGRVKGAELEMENNRLVYSFDIERQKVIHEVQVDANTGIIVSDKIETAADEQAEQQQKQRKK
jgi:uncharacterized membrane protein YkoI